MRETSFYLFVRLNSENHSSALLFPHKYIGLYRPVRVSYPQRTHLIYCNTTCDLVSSLFDATRNVAFSFRLLRTKKKQCNIHKNTSYETKINYFLLISLPRLRASAIFHVLRCAKEILQIVSSHSYIFCAQMLNIWNCFCSFRMAHMDGYR